jgi:CRP-like cAMP-binding protein
MPHPIHHKLKAIPLFHDYTDQEIEEFLELTDPTAFTAGEVIVRQSEPGNCMYYVAEGRVRVIARRGGDLVELASLGPGEIFGELSLFDHQPRSADVQAISDTILLKCNEGVLRALAGVYPAAAFKFVLGTVREIGERLRKANARYVDTILGKE